MGILTIAQALGAAHSLVGRLGHSLARRQVEVCLRVVGNGLDLGRRGFRLRRLLLHDHGERLGLALVFGHLSSTHKCRHVHNNTCVHVITIVIVIP